MVEHLYGETVYEYYDQHSFTPFNGGIFLVLLKLTMMEMVATTGAIFTDRMPLLSPNQHKTPKGEKAHDQYSVDKNFYCRDYES